MTLPDSSPQAREALSAPTPRRATPVDWERVVALLAEGRSTREVADDLGCSRQTVWNVMRRSRAMDNALYDAEREIGTNANLRLRGLRPKLADALAAELDKGNVRVMLWLADRLQIADRLRARGFDRRPGADPLDAQSFAAPTRSLDALFSPDKLDACLESRASALTVNAQR